MKLLDFDMLTTSEHYIYMCTGALERLGAHGGLLQDGRAPQGQVQVPPRARRRAARARRRQEGLQDAAAVARGALQPAPPAHGLRYAVSVTVVPVRFLFRKRI